MNEDDLSALFDRAMEALFGGSPEDIGRYWHADLRWYGLHRSGEQRVYEGLGGLMEAMMEPPPVVDRLSEEVVDRWVIGDGVVAARVLGRRRAVATGEEIEREFLFAVRFENGVITQVIDLVDGTLVDFWRRATEAASG